MNLRKSKNFVPLLILGVFGILILTMGILNHYFFRTVTYDYGNYNFAFWDYAHLRISPLPTFRGTFLQDHFSFTLFYFIPFYWLLNWLTQTYTLIIIQNACIIVAGWYSFKIIRLKSDSLWMTAGVLIYYFVILGRYTTFLADVNLAIISSCFIPVFIYYFKTKKYWVAFVILVLALFSRENIPLWFISIFMVLIIDHRKDKKAVLFSTTGIILSVIYFILLFKVFIPAIETPDKQYVIFNYSALGKGPGEAIVYILKHPVEAVKMFFVNHTGNPTYDGIKAEFYWVYLISGGFVLLLRPQYLIWFVPVVAQKVLNDAYVRWGIGTYYSIEVVTLLPLSVFLALSSLKSEKLKKILSVLVCISTLSMTLYKLERQNNKVPWLFDSAKVKIYDKEFFKASFDVKEVNKLLKLIPENASLSASNKLLPHLAQRERIYFFPKVEDAEYLVLSVYDNHYLYSHAQNDQFRQKYFSSNEWELIAHEFPVFLFKKITSSESSNGNQIKWSNTSNLLCDFEDKEENTNTLLSDKEINEMKHLLSDEKARSGQTSIKLTPESKYAPKIKLPGIKPKDHVEISIWYYSTEKNTIHLVAEGIDNYKHHNSEPDSVDIEGWKHLVLSFWVPENESELDGSTFFWNSGSEPAYIDDLQITIKTMETK